MIYTIIHHYRHCCILYNAYCFIICLVSLLRLYINRYGMIGSCLSDYKAAGGWDARWGYHWGAEDVDLMHRLQDIIPYTVRVKETEYMHQHTEETRRHSM